jgi:hypothetical protein
MSVSLERTTPKWLREVVICLLAGTVGGAMVWLGQGRSLQIKPLGITYSDLISTLLTAVALIIAVFGVVMAVLAIFGYQHFKTVVERTSKESAEDIAAKTAKEIVDDKVNSDEFKQLIVLAVANRMTDAEKDGSLAAWTNEQNKQQAVLKEIDEDRGGDDEH